MAGGGRRETTLRTSLKVRKACRSNILEETLDAVQMQDGAIDLVLRPFQILTLKLER